MKYRFNRNVIKKKTYFNPFSKGRTEPIKNYASDLVLQPQQNGRCFTLDCKNNNKDSNI